MTDQRERPNLDRAHRRARERGVMTPLYALVRPLLTPMLRLWFRMRISGSSAGNPVPGVAAAADPK
jgi:hypothetical protein